MHTPSLDKESPSLGFVVRSEPGVRFTILWVDSRPGLRGTCTYTWVNTAFFEVYA